MLELEGGHGDGGGDDDRDVLVGYSFGAEVVVMRSQGTFCFLSSFIPVFPLPPPHCAPN